MLLGALVESGQRAGASGGDTLNRWPGVLLCAAVIVGGYLVVVRAGAGPLATAGVTAAALAVPAFWFFVMLDNTSSVFSELDGILLLSTLVWLVGSLVGPTRGRSFLLALGLVSAWLYVLDQVEGALSPTFFLPSVSFSFSDTSTPVFTRVPSTSNSGAISLAFAAVYLIAVRVLDKRGGRGVATPFALAGIITLFAGIALLANDLEEIGTGVALIAAGLVLALLGAVGERRGTTWLGGASVAFGAAVLAAKAAGDDVDAFAVLLIAFGAAVVVLGAWLQLGAGEPDEAFAGPSTFRFGSASSSPPSEPTITTF